MQREESVSDSASIVEMRPAMLAADKASSKVTSVANEESTTEFWMSTRQTQCGANLTDRMASFMKAVIAAQSEFADKLTAITTAELGRTKMNTDTAAVYDPYWEQLQLSMRLCRTMASSTKEMTVAVGMLMPQMDRIGMVGRSRLKESANWNVELNNALSEFHTNISKKQAKCFKALSVVMTPDYFDQSPARKAQSVRRAAPTVMKYVEEIEQANSWLHNTMKQRPTLKNRLEVLETKRLDVTRKALTTLATQIQIMGQVMAEAAGEIVENVNNIDDNACKRAFIADCGNLPTPHLESPDMFQYQLPVPVTELGIRPIRDPETEFSPAPQRATSLILNEAAEQSRSTIADAGSRITSLAMRMFSNKGSRRTSSPVTANNTAAPVTSAKPERVEEEENSLSAESVNDPVVFPFGNIVAGKDANRPSVATGENRPVGAGVGAPSA